jgi:uncharacterized protein
MSFRTVPDLGVGVGLRVPHYAHVLQAQPSVDFFEVISENFLVEGGRPLYHLHRVLESYRVVPHGVSLGIGGPEPPDRGYLERLRRLLRRIEPPWVTDHLCWCGAGGAHLHDLLPLPYTSEMVSVVAERARVVQDLLEVPLALENTSSYLTFTASTMTEWEFVSEIVERAGVGLLLDVNNVYVSAHNHGFDPWRYVRSVPHERILQIHLAGHTPVGPILIDTHRGRVKGAVLDLYREAIALAGPVSTLVEWDDDIPPFETLLDEADRVRGVRAEGLLERERRQHGAPPRVVMTEPPPARVAPSEARAWPHGGPRETVVEAPPGE